MTSQAARNSFNRRADGTSEALQVSDALFRQMMDGVLDWFDQGITAFDVELCLIARNGRFAEMRELPPELLRAGTHYEACVRYILARASTDRPEEGVMSLTDARRLAQTRLSTILNTGSHCSPFATPWSRENDYS